MSSAALRQETTLPFVEGTLNYLVPMAEKPFNLAYEPPEGVARSNGVYAPQKMRVYDARPLASSVSIDREGFELLRAPSQVRDFYDEAELKRVYYAETAELVQQATRAARVVVFDHTIRRRVPGALDRRSGTPRQPVDRVHNDYTEASGPQRVRDLCGEEAAMLLRRRFAFINVWRPIRGPLLDAPLAVCDARSVAPGDLVASDLVYPDRKGETYAVTYNAAHRWFYAPAMSADEVLLLKCYDTPASGAARFAPHSAFVDPTTPANAPPRESIELRTIAFYPG
jgi:hypothetical protein